jgi:hypothetical protein
MNEIEIRCLKATGIDQIRKSIAVRFSELQKEALTYKPCLDTS